MKKHTSTGKLTLKPETLKILQVTDLKDLAGGAPKTTIQLPCIPPGP